MGNLLFWLCFVLLLFLFVCLFARLFVRLFCFVLVLVVVLFLDFIPFCSRLNEFMKPPDSLPTKGNVIERVSFFRPSNRIQFAPCRRTSAQHLPTMAPVLSIGLCDLRSAGLRT